MSNFEFCQFVQFALNASLCVPALLFRDSVVSNFGVNVQKMAHTQLIESGSTESYATKPLWITGASVKPQKYIHHFKL